MTGADAERAYWLLVAALALVDVQQRSLDLALELERNNRARVDVGQSPPLDLVAARAEVAQRQENLIVARTAALQSEDLLRTLIIDPKRDDYWSFGSSRPTDARRRPAARRRRRGAPRARRADGSGRARKEIQNIETNVALSKSQTLPDLRLQASYLTNGAGGSRLIRDGGFPGTIVGTETRRSAACSGQVFTADYPTWTLGFSFSYPLGNSAAEANLARARIERDQSMARLRSLELTAVRAVRDAASRLEQNRQRIETTRLGRSSRSSGSTPNSAASRSACRRASSSFRRSAISRSPATTRLQALLDYQLAVIAFETSQQTSGSGCSSGTWRPFNDSDPAKSTSAPDRVVVHP